ncbi:C-type lectin domain family 10 member A-like [Branchiostoma floridae]|uniref:C-type lectin domain family 10 member A-like n=1 Tax=Branchiostoma floridae TaxID=7739 RepID=C3ZIF3_BRAFL|nr:C-type lectin domain family 10 member A-like [Branchiostoma floridae]|eukprot:XP_002591667.1 hypothetical protein BRAFLDRAFT_80757 [Branchiostoma floridae]
MAACVLSIVTMVTQVVVVLEVRNLRSELETKLRHKEAVPDGKDFDKLRGAKAALNDPRGLPGAAGSSGRDGRDVKQPGTVSPENLACPSGYVKFQDTCFSFSNERRNHAEARCACQTTELNCQTTGGHLALPKDQATNDFLVNQIHDRYPNGDDVWFGLTDQLQEGEWAWDDGAPLGTGWTNWYTGQPDDGADGFSSAEDCARWREDSYKWDDGSCFFPRHYVCEVSAAVP